MTSFFTHYPRRKLEWAIALYTVYFGAALLLPRTSMASYEFGSVLHILPEALWGCVYIAVGLIHNVALHVNGRGCWTPFARLAALSLNSQVFLALSLASAHSNAVSMSAITYFGVTIFFCGPAIWAAAGDCGREIAIMRGAHDRN
ncbi:hypothetical protein ACMA5I_06590 [Paracoccaceae bacterium GXU_MW_L88]